MSKKLPTSPGTKVDQSSAWKAESLRLTAFLNPGVSVDWSNWWRDVVGEAPEARIEKPRQGALREEGPFLSGRLVLAIEPLRVDWVLTVGIQEALETATFDVLPDSAASVSAFSALAKRWLGIGVPIVRLAWGAVLLAPVVDREEGYRGLAPYLPSLNIDPLGSSDLHYQINRRRPSVRHPGLSINRLSKWSVVQVQAARIQIGPLSGPSAPVQTMGDALSACRLELDVNTPAENVTVFSAEVAQALLDELVELATEIAKKGDVP